MKLQLHYWSKLTLINISSSHYYIFCIHINMSKERKSTCQQPSVTKGLTTAINHKYRGATDWAWNLSQHGKLAYTLQPLTLKGIVITINLSLELRHFYVFFMLKSWLASHIYSCLSCTSNLVLNLGTMFFFPFTGQSFSAKN